MIPAAKYLQRAIDDQAGKANTALRPVTVKEQHLSELLYYAQCLEDELKRYKENNNK